MSTANFEKRSRIEAPAEEVFAWHEREGALERLTPPWDAVEVVEREGGIADGDRVTLKIGPRPLRVRWVAEHYGFEPGREFHDRQTRGPFARWDHTHLVEPDGPGACWLTDRIEYELPLSTVSGPIANSIVAATLKRTFDYRHRTISGDLSMHRSQGKKTMTILISGATGMIGSALSAALTTGGHSVRRLVRSQPTDESEFHWDPNAGELDPAALEGVDAVVHLSGETVAGRWSASKKRAIMDSRVQGTGLLAGAIAEAAVKPQVLVCASAIGYYGDRGDQLLDEQSAAGDGFLAEVVQAWEGATEPAAQAGVRVANTRFGIVLSPAGGMLGQILTPFKLGVGGPLGSGKQYMSWVAIDDVVGAINEALTNERLSGPVNVTVPNVVTNAEFTKTLAHVLHRPAVMKVPGFALKGLLGEFAGEALGGQRVQPKRLTEAGYEFRYPELEGALRHLLGRTG